MDTCCTCPSDQLVIATTTLGLKGAFQSSGLLFEFLLCLGCAQLVILGAIIIFRRRRRDNTALLSSAHTTIFHSADVNRVGRIVSVNDDDLIVSGRGSTFHSSTGVTSASPSKVHQSDSARLGVLFSCLWLFQRPELPILFKAQL